MNIWAKIVTALRGGVNEAGEAVVDSQALRILDQEIRDADDELKVAKDNLAAIMAKQKVSEEKTDSFKKKVKEHEDYAVQALEKKDEKLALEVAEKIADLENQYDNEREVAKGYAHTADQMRAAVKQAERNIKRLKQQADSVKATESVQKAQAAVAERHSGANSKMQTAMESLERIKDKQAHKGAQMEAARELAEDGDVDALQTKLEKAGIAPSGKSASDVLERLKKKAK